MKRHVLLILAVIAAASSAADDTTQTAADSTEETLFVDPVFIEMSLSPFGIEAIDSIGEPWHYDFGLETFVPGAAQAIVDGAPGESGPRDLDMESIKDRATERRVIESFARRSIIIDYDEYVDGDVIVWGRVTVKGWVKGGVKSLQSRVLVTQTGRVDGDIDAPEVIVREGAVVLGRVNQGQSPSAIQELPAQFSADGFIVALVFTVFAGLIAFMGVTLAPAKTERMIRCSEAYKGRCFALGLLMLLSFPLILVMIVITIVGVLLSPLLPLAYAVAATMGLLAFGRILLDRIGFLNRTGRLRPLRCLLGVAIFMSLWLLTGLLMGSSDGTAEAFGVFFLVCAILVTVFAGSVGIGAALLTRFGWRDYAASQTHPGRLQRAPVPAPPPIPEPPPLEGDKPSESDDGETSRDSDRSSNKDR